MRPRWNLSGKSVAVAIVVVGARGQSLMKRVFQVDLEKCLRCGSPMKLCAVITEPVSAYVVWSSSDGVGANRYSSNGGWGAATSLSAEGAEVAIAVAHNGQSIAVWTEAEREIWAAHYW